MNEMAVFEIYIFGNDREAFGIGKATDNVIFGKPFIRQFIDMNSLYPFFLEKTDDFVGNMDITKHFH